MHISASMRLVEQGNLLAIGDVVLNERITLHQVKLIQDPDKKEMMLSLPRRKREDGKWENVISVSPEVFDEIKKAVIAAVRESLAYECPYEIEIRNQGLNKDQAQVRLTVPEACLSIEGIRVKKGKYGRYVVWPKQTIADGTEIELVTLTVSEKKEVEKAIIRKFEMLHKKGMNKKARR